MKHKHLKILHAPTTVGGNPQNISRAERELGYYSRNLTLVQNYFNYDVDEVIFKDNDLSIKNEIKRWGAIFNSLKNYNILHYNFGQSISPIIHCHATHTYSKWKVFFYTDIYCRLTEFLDLKLAKLMGHVTAVTYQGDDARQGDYCKENYPIHFAHEVNASYYTLCSDELKRARIKKVDRYVDLIYSVNPDLMNVLPKRTKFLPYANVSLNNWPPKWVDDNIEIPHVVHAPSHREVKGTKYIIEAFERLKSESINFRYTLVENMPHTKAREVYETADLLVDQVLAGYYGGLAVECMALGKPVICYMREEDMHYLPKKMWEQCPIINTTPDTIYDTLKDWLVNRKKELHQRGKQSRAYVEEWHDPLKIAQSLINDYERVMTEKSSSKSAF